ncbi:hypothetical protein BD410DRAFT_837679 [Rickenella mellea]|uniref:Uncharacterized protein n=1 Tax=Rickenella mellea TaxID=50990 RepID=A0A4Y7QCD3_9AGAM|nr:hypothetical protein BD410DRAFT_837679 [Rickenella mellea]
MNVASKGAHLAGNPHRMAVAAQAANPVIADPVAANTWTCETCQRTMNLTSKYAHLAGRAHRAMSGEAEEETDIPPHPNGQHRIPIRSVAEVYGHIDEIPLAVYRRAGITANLVTSRDVQRASDQWDGEGILHDIDTQWGMMPHGGAYKESNFYYGPGDDDYY